MSLIVGVFFIFLDWSYDWLPMFPRLLVNVEVLLEILWKGVLLFWLIFNLFYIRIAHKMLEKYLSPFFFYFEYFKIVHAHYTVSAEMDKAS